MQPIWERNMSKFQTSGVKGKGVIDNLFVERIYWSFQLFGKRAVDNFL